MALRTVWAASYYNEAAPTISTTKQRGVVAQAQAEGLISLIPALTGINGHVWGDIARTHDPRFVRAVLKGRPKHLAESQGFKWSKDFSRSVAGVWYGHQTACNLAVRTGGVVMHPVSGAHHARRSQGGGFCTFNYVVGAAERLLERGEIASAMIIDLDAHQGDGTYDLVNEDPRFTLFDIAEQEWYCQAKTERRFYQLASTAREYAQLLAYLPDYLDRAKPGLVQYQAGMDCHENDFMGSIAGMNAKLLAARDEFVIRQVVQRGIPLVINLAGGYQGNGITEALHVETFRIAARLTS